MISWLSPGMFSFFKTIDYFKNFKGVCYFMSNLYSSWFFEYFVNFHQLTCDVLRDLVPFVLYKKREKHPWRSVNFSSKVADFSLQLTKINTPQWVFFTFFILYKWYQIAQRTIHYKLFWQLIRISSPLTSCQNHKNLMTKFCKTVDRQKPSDIQTQKTVTS